MIIDDTAEINIKVGPQLPIQSSVKGIKRSRVSLLLNKEPNLFQDISSFRRNLIIDYLIDGIFLSIMMECIYTILPASKMKIHASETTYIEKFTLQRASRL